MDATTAVKGPEVGGHREVRRHRGGACILQALSLSSGRGQDHWLHRAEDEFSPGAHSARATEEM